MNEKMIRNIKIIALLISFTLMILAGISFYQHRNYSEAVVPSSDLSEVKKLSEYFSELEGTPSDCNIYFFDSGNEGGTLFLIGGTHPEEPAANLSAQVFV